MKVFNKNTTIQTPTTPQGGAPHMQEPISKRTTIILIAIAVLIIGLFAGIILVQQKQTPQKQASEPGPSCPLDGFRCTWEKEEGVEYECIISEVTGETTKEVARPTVKEDQSTGKGLCTFTPEPNTEYNCTVKAVLFPGCEASDTASAGCTALTPTPTLTPTPSPTMTPTPTPNPQCYITTCDPKVANTCETLGLPKHTCTDTDPSTTATDYRCVLNEKCVNAPAETPELCWCYAPTPTPSPTPSPTPTKTPTATPTTRVTSTPGPTSTPPPGATLTPTTSPTPGDIIVVNPTSTPTQVIIAQSTPIPTSTPVPTLPVAGNSTATYLILLVGAVVVAIGLAL